MIITKYCNKSYMNVISLSDNLITWMATKKFKITYVTHINIYIGKCCPEYNAI